MTIRARSQLWTRLRPNERGVSLVALPDPLAQYQCEPIRCIDLEGCWWPKVRVEHNKSGTCCELDHVCWLVERERMARKRGGEWSRP